MYKCEPVGTVTMMIICWSYSNQFMSHGSFIYIVAFIHHHVVRCRVSYTV